MKKIITKVIFEIGRFCGYTYASVILTFGSEKQKQKMRDKNSDD